MTAASAVTALRTLAPGKVNLCLFVGRPRDDGLHPLVSLVQPVSLADELRLAPAAAGGTAEDEVVCPGVAGPNLAGAALAAYRSAAGWRAPAQRLTITKRVPVAAGMGGGSGDAAAALRLAAHAAGRPGDPLLAELAPRLGADVPAQVAPRRALVTGAGEGVAPLASPEPFGLVIVPVDAPLATAAVYAEADRRGLARDPAALPELAAAVAAAVRAGGPLPPDLVVNDLEDAARALCPAIDPALEALRAHGAERPLVSGSGPTVFATFPGRDGPGRAREVAAEPVGVEAGRVHADP